MTTEETLLRRNVSELRALLDLSYDRERLLANALVGILRLCDGAAFAPDRQDQSVKVLDSAKKALEELQSRPVVNRGLFVAHLNSAVAVAALQAARDGLVRDLRNAHHLCADLRAENAELLSRVRELNDMPLAVSHVLEDPDLRDRVAEKVKAITT